MAYDLEEQEQLASIKAWWNQYGNLLSWLLIIVLGAYAGWTGWNYYQRGQSAQASGLYDEMQKMVQAKDNAKALRLASDIQSRYASSAYASMSALVAAKSAFDANDLKTAKAQLQWVAEHGSDEYKSIAKLRLAGVLLDEKAFDAALKLLAGEFLPQFAGSVADRKGDILVAQNKLAEARAAYQAALAAMDKNNPGRELVQVKLDAIGGASGAPAPKAAA
jgi:predicted negative regulator of RcsB-dependent stress response